MVNTLHKKPEEPAEEELVPTVPKKWKSAVVFSTGGRRVIDTGEVTGREKRQNCSEGDGSLARHDLQGRQRIVEFPTDPWKATLTLLPETGLQGRKREAGNAKGVGSGRKSFGISFRARRDGGAGVGHVRRRRELTRIVVRSFRQFVPPLWGEVCK